jgi:hypothetical protein
MLFVPPLSLYGQELDSTYLGLQKGDKVRVGLSIFHPTQSFIGQISVDIKAKNLARLIAEGSQAIAKYFKKNPIPVVIGPDGRFYLIDHHHQLKASVQVGITQFNAEIVANRSDLSMEEFKRWMIKKNYVYLRDANDQRIEFENLPNSIMDLKDFPFRSLAGEVEDNGGFKKVQVPFTEFEWARFYQKYFTAEEITSRFNQVLVRALEISHFKTARSLPGYIKASKSCKTSIIK